MLYHRYIIKRIAVVNLCTLLKIKFAYPTETINDWDHICI